MDENSNSRLPTLPLIHEWKLKNQLNKSEADLQKHNIKFSIISKQSMPFLNYSGHKKNEQQFKGFRVNKQKQNSSYHYLTNKHYRMVQKNQSEQLQRIKKSKKLQKLRNKRNYERHKLQLEYQNLRINTIIQCAAQELIEKQNKMLNGMI